MTQRLRRNELRRAQETVASCCVGCLFRDECASRQIAPPQRRQVRLAGA